MMRELWRLGRSLPLAVLSGALWLVLAAACIEVFCAGLFTLGVAAGWLWLRTPHLLGLTAAWVAITGAGIVVALVAGYVREAVRTVRFRIDPVAYERAYGFYVPAYHTRPGWPSVPPAPFGWRSW